MGPQFSILTDTWIYGSHDMGFPYHSVKYFTQIHVHMHSPGNIEYQLFIKQLKISDPETNLLNT